MIDTPLHGLLGIEPLNYWYYEYVTITYLLCLVKATEWLMLIH